MTAEGFLVTFVTFLGDCLHGRGRGLKLKKTGAEFGPGF